MINIQDGARFPQNFSFNRPRLSGIGSTSVFILNGKDSNANEEGWRQS